MFTICIDSFEVMTTASDGSFNAIKYCKQPEAVKMAQIRALAFERGIAMDALRQKGENGRDAF